MSSEQTHAYVFRLQLTGVMGLRFIQALTRGGPGGMPRPIEMHAHDPRRYLGDMLAWVHQVGGPPLPLCCASVRVACTKTSIIILEKVPAQHPVHRIASARLCRGFAGVGVRT